MSTTRRGAVTKDGAAAVASGAGESTGSAPASEGEAPAAKTRHGLYFFLFFWVPLIALFIFAIVKGREG